MEVWVDEDRRTRRAILAPVVGRVLATLRAVPGSLKFRLTLGVGAGLALGIGLITLLLVRQAERDVLAAQHQRELGEAVRTASVLSRRVVDLQRMLHVTAAQLDAQRLADDRTLQAFMESQPALRLAFSHLFVAAPDGRMRIWVDDGGARRPLRTVADRPYFQRTVQERRSVVSEPVVGRVADEPVIVVSQPVIHAGEVKAVMAGALRLASRDLAADLVDGQDGSSEALLVVADGAGRVLAHPSRAQLLHSLALEPRLGEAFARWQSSGSAAEPAGLLLEQSGQVVSAAGVAGTDWVVWRALPQSSLLAPLHAARSQALRWAGGLIAALALLTLAGVSLLLRPLRQLEARAAVLFDARQDPHAGWPKADGEIGHLARVLRHVTAERAQLEAFNDEVLKKLGSVMRSAPLGIVFTRHRRIELVSDEFCRLVGWPQEEILGQPARLVYASDEDFEAVGPLLVQAFAAAGDYVGEWQLRRRDGSRFWAQLRARPVDSADPHAGTIWTVADVSLQVQAREQLEWSASHDPLTGLANRKGFEERLQRVFAARPQSLPACVVVIDLDHFKPVNDQCGHAAGDAMLKAVSATLSSQVRARDLVVRTGGDEFAILLEQCPAEAALRIAQSVQRAVSQTTVPWNGEMLRVGASVGVAALGERMESVADWVQAADAACYAAKFAGRGTVRVAGQPQLAVVTRAESTA